jgi:hypothetical protein
MSKMTDWFPPHIKPVHIGIYEIKFYNLPLSKRPMYARWNGKKWSNFAYKKHDDSLNDYVSAVQKKHWRGFKEKQA